ncbi:sodium/hydrogen exchanger [Gloeothece citriformis PCC 7424]|uniref:Sodium/hydrogen exchanger n=1 Tax=Gloeothece citriformis (strain PCC 7424) TaxID=65393 RepID=B7KCW1_GLOC7|nr:cation:proton antiporter [Gloeothece citriformis]ACK73082.1 sodium/hydrogen exchanger [Gloeothece citriformis PCC 7424]
MEKILEHIYENPLFSFTILLLVVLILPPIFEKFKLPGLVGLLVAGVLLGQNGLHLIDPKSETMKLFSDIGKIYLMFVAGLEIDLKEFKKTKDRSLTFGFSTFIFPLITGVLVGRWFGFSWNSSFLIGSLLASHTLLGFPIVQQLGKVKNRAVIITVGATIFTDISALLVLAVCVSIHQGDFTPQSLVWQLVTLAIYSAAVLFGLDWAGKEYFRRTGDQEGNQFLFILLALFIASFGAELINVEQIVGAFLAGLAVNDVLGGGPVEEKIEFVGSTLFIPFFFIGMGLLLDVPTFIETIQSDSLLVIGIVGGLILSKLVAALVIKFIYRYQWDEGLTMWSLSLPQVAATLAAALVAYETVNANQERLINESVLSTIIVLMLVTSILGPVLTDKFARRLPTPKANLDIIPEVDTPSEHSTLSEVFTVVVPIYNPRTERDLITMAALLARYSSGIIVPLSITPAHTHMDDPIQDLGLQNSRLLLDRALAISQEFAVETKPIIRIDDDVANGICRTAKEYNANLIVMGWSANTSFQARLFGNMIDKVFWSSHCPVAVMRLLKEPMNIHRVLIPVKYLSPQIMHIIRFTQQFAQTNQAQVTLLRVCDRKTPKAEMVTFEKELSQVVEQLQPTIEMTVRTIRNDNVAQAVLQVSHDYDMVILRSMRRRTVAGLAVSDVTTQLLKKLTCSVVLFGEPHNS